MAVVRSWGEDLDFVELLLAQGEQVALHADEEGIAVRVQHGNNLARSVAHRVVCPSWLNTSPVAPLLPPALTEASISKVDDLGLGLLVLPEGLDTMSEDLVAAWMDNPEAGCAAHTKALLRKRQKEAQLATGATPWAVQQHAAISTVEVTSSSPILESDSSHVGGGSCSVTVGLDSEWERTAADQEAWRNHMSTWGPQASSRLTAWEHEQGCFNVQTEQQEMDTAQGAFSEHDQLGEHILERLSPPATTIGTCESSFEIVYVNLDTRKDRRLHIECELSKAGLVATRLSAFTGDQTLSSCVTPTWDSTLNARFDTNTIGHPAVAMSAGERGCAMSHRAVWQLCAHRPDTALPLVVLEDDAVLSLDFSKRVTALVQGMQTIWADPTSRNILVYLCAVVPRWRGNTFEVSSGVGLRESTYQWQTTAYIIWPAAARMLLAEPNPIDCPVDNYVARATLKRSVRSFVAQPVLARQHMLMTIGDVVHSNCLRPGMQSRDSFRQAFDTNEARPVRVDVCVKQHREDGEADGSRPMGASGELDLQGNLEPTCSWRSADVDDID